jgi:hypothetical protein
MAQSLVSYSTGTLITDFVTRTSALFDNVTSSNTDAATAKNGVSSVYAGKDWGSGVTKNISGFKIYATTDEGFGSLGSTITCTLYGSTDNSSWVNLGNTTATDANSLVVTKLTGLTPAFYRYHKVVLSLPSAPNTMFCAEVQFYETPATGYSFGFIL